MSAWFRPFCAALLTVLCLVSAPARGGEPLAPERVVEILSARYKGRTPSLWGEHLPGVVSRLCPAGVRPGLVLALTFDACGHGPGNGYDAQLIAFLRRHSLPATLFVSSRWIRANREVFLDLAADPLFEIGGHGARHKPCSVNGRSAYGIKGTASLAELVLEVEENARDIAGLTGKRPRWFRSGAAYYDDVAVSVIRDLGFSLAGYSIAADQGARLGADEVARRVRRAGHGDILLFHMNRPGSGALGGLQKALPELLDRGATFVRLSDAR